MSFTDKTDPESPKTIVEEHVERILSPFDVFIKNQASTGILLGVTALLAMIIANSPWHEIIHFLAAIPVGFHANGWALDMHLHEWINSGLMALFFFHIGLELKREVLAGELRNVQQMVLVLSAAAGGMIVPAGIYFLMNMGDPAQIGWAIPMATDTAFALGALALLAKRVSPSIAVFLVALAIFDDLGAIIVIALFYTQAISVIPLLWAAAAFAVLVCFNVIGIRKPWFYAVLGAVLWYFVHDSGIHGTVAGILVAFAIPARPKVKEEYFKMRIKALVSRFEKKQTEERGILEHQDQHDLVVDVQKVAERASTPLQRWEGELKTPIGLLVLPIFALFNAGVMLSTESLGAFTNSSVVWGVILGLVVGKPVGIALFCFIALRCKLGTMPKGMNFADIIGAGLLAGMGFTMSLLIADLGFAQMPELIEPVKLAILLSSLASAVFGLLWLYFRGKRVACAA
tara:strand:- start:708790 stop:710163 length:1374 start_codon:yes stop_codon:yes gene_type:complete